LSRLATLDGQDIPTGGAMQATPGGVAEHLVSVPAATGTVTVRPSSFVMSVIEGSVPIPQARHYLLDQRGHSVGHAGNSLLNCLSSSVLPQNGQAGYRSFLADNNIQICLTIDY
jgi:hypothetical protein